MAAVMTALPDQVLLLLQAPVMPMEEPNVTVGWTVVSIASLKVRIKVALPALSGLAGLMVKF